MKKALAIIITLSLLVFGPMFAPVEATNTQGDDLPEVVFPWE